MPYKDKEKRLEYNKQYSKRYRILYKDKLKIQAKEIYEERKQTHLCVQCGKPTSIGSIYCLLHRNRRILRNRKYWDRPEVIASYHEKKKRRYNRLKSENKCVYCTMPLNEESRMGILCLSCYMKTQKTGG